MATKSDFAQKLLHDLRVRKERMAAGQSSSQQPTQASRAALGNTKQASRGSPHMNALESASSRRSKNRTHTSIITNETTNQIILYKSGEKASGRQVKDLSMAIALAFEKGGNLTSIRASATSQLVNFFNRFGRKSRETQKMDLTTFSSNRSKIPTISNIQVSEVSRGVQRLNQILRACSSGYGLDGGSIEIGKELLKGAMDLEEALRVLVNLQDASQYADSTRNKGRFELLDEDEDDKDGNANMVEKWELGQPKFSFDGPRRGRLDSLGFDEVAGRSSSDLDVVCHQRPTSYFKDLGLFMQVKEARGSSSSQPTQEKKRISNVVAKLMGLEETPHNEELIGKKNERRESKNPQNGHSITTTRVNERHQIFGDKQRKQNPTTDRQCKTIESESKIQKLNTELQQKAQNSKARQVEHKANNKIEYDLGAPSTETRKANEELPRNKEKQEEKCEQLQEQMLRRGDTSQDKPRKGKYGQQLQKQNLLTKNSEMESMTTSKSKKSKANDWQKVSCDRPAPGNKRSPKATTKIPVKDLPQRAHRQEAPTMDTSSQQPAPNREDVKKEEIHKSCTIEPKRDVENENGNLGFTKGKSIEVSTIPKKVQRSEIAQKIDVLMSRRDANVNHLTRSTKQPAKLLKDLKQMHIKHRNSKRKENQSDKEIKNEKDKRKEDQSDKEIKNEKEGNIEPEKQQDKLGNEENKGIMLNMYMGDKNQIDNEQNAQALNNNGDTIATNAGKVSNDLETVEELYAHKDELNLKQCDQSTGEHDRVSIELHNLPQNVDKQTPIPDRRKQLTEPEKHLKELAIKSQTFLSTAEALFKLNFPTSFLHAAEQYYEAPENKLVLNCAQEVMKRKARRHEVANQTHTKAALAGPKVRSFDDLIEQLSEDLETLKFYGGYSGDDGDLAARLNRMLEKDIRDRDADVNCMWELEWSNLTALVSENDDAVREVERYMLNGLLDEVTGDLVVLTPSGSAF